MNNLKPENRKWLSPIKGLLLLTMIFLINACQTDPEVEPEPVEDDPTEAPTFDNLVTINTEDVAGVLYPYWNTRPMINQDRFNNANFRNSLEEIKSYTTHYNLVRMLGGRKDNKNEFYKGVDSSGKIITDFTELITSMRNFMTTGFKPRLVLDNVPWEMVENKVVNTFGNSDPPDNYELWNQYIKAFLQALIDEFGYDEVKTWRLRVGTEPNFVPGHWTGTKEQYFRHYDETVAAVTSVIPEIEIGPGNVVLNQSASNWGMDIIDHCGGGINYVTGQRGTQMDFFAFSYYEFLRGETVNLDGHMTTANARLNQYPQFVDIPLDIQEFGILVDEFGNGDGSLNDATEYGGSWLATISEVVYRQNMSEIYEWGYGAEGLDDPRRHVIELLRKMEGGSRLNVQGSLSGFSGVIPSATDGKIYLFVYNHEPVRTSTKGKTISPKITGSMVAGVDNWTMNEWTIDREHGEFMHDLYNDLEAAGVGKIAGGRIFGTRLRDYWQDDWETLFESNKSKYEELAKLPQTMSNEPVATSDNAIQLEIALTSHSVKLIELTPR